VVHPKGRDDFENLGVGAKITLERILEKEGVKVWIGCMWLMIGTSAGLL
jgi:hypothetical protein